METEAVWRTARAPERARGHARPEPEAYPDAARPRVRPARAVPAAWNGADADYPRHATLHSLVEAQVRRTPTAPALHFAGETVSYAEMDTRASRIAARLRALGVGPERRVALCVERGPAQIVALLGILKAGGAYVPIDPAAPAERRDSLVADVGATALIADLPVDAAVPVVRPDDGGDGAATECGTGPDSLAYVLYTSGSTGKPKGVLGTHRGMVNLVHWQARAFGAGPGDRVLQWAPLSFDAASAEIFMALTSGAALVLATREQLVPGRELVEILRARRITHAKFTPTALAALPFADLPDLRVVATGGEACTAELVRRWGAGRRFFNVYGPTECSVRAAAGEMRPGEAPSIGRPLPNARVHVVGADGLPAAAGAEGELCIGGVGLARGYLGHPALTARAFVPDAFSGRPGARLYRSGDRARWTPAGELEFLGRLDDQVKIRGFRVEPGEVTAALRAVPGVREAAVVARADGEVRLVAYFAGDESLTPATLRAALERRLLDHMVPAAFVRVAAIPLTAHGKVDRRALPDPDEGGEGGPPLEAILQAARVSVDEPPFVPVHRCAPRTESRADDVDVDARANRLARRLIRLTGGAGERIAVALPSPEQLAVAVLGVLKAGAVCIIPDDDDGVLRDAALVVTTRATASDLHLPTAVLCLEADAELLSRESSSPPYVAVDADATALVVSGIAISHALLAAVMKLDRAMLRGVPALARLAWAVDGSGG